MDDIILRDYLAIDRTYLANERTFLAYIRTALTGVIGGITLQKLFPADGVMVSLGWFLLLAGLFAGVFGIWRSVSTHRRIKAYYSRERAAEALACLNAEV